jgi:putative ABC transport system permease protein
MEQEIFGLPSLTLATYMGGILIAILSIILIGGLRRFILVKMGTKNIPRRKGQSTLIVVGLMLSSVIIATSLGIGDTVRYSVRSVVFESLGNADEVITGPGKVLFGDEYFEYSKFKDVQNIISQNSNIDAVLPYIEISLPAENDESGLAESNVTVRGIEETLSDNFDTLKNLDGATVSINSLQAGEVYINEGTQKKLKISKGGTLGIYSRAGKVDFVVKDILEGKGLAGSSLNSYILFELEELQSLVDKEGMITTIAISNTGKGEKSLESSEEVTKFLRSNLTNNNTALEFFNILSANDIPKLIREEAMTIAERDGELSEDLNKIADDLDNNNFNDDFITSISGYPIQLTILGVLDKSGLQDEAGNLLMISGDLTVLRVDDAKYQGVKLAETVATGVTTIFSIFGSFSIMVGLLLIFLVFVLLAAARSTELGMARAVGLKRRDLIQLFVYEGTVYSFLSAIAGTLIGIGLSFGLVYVLKDLIGTDNFVLRPYYSATSIIIAFSSGLILTFITVFISAYRVSNLNIVVAIRGLKEEFVKKAPQSFSVKLINLAWDMLFPVKQLIRIVKGNGARIRNLILLLLSPLVWPINILMSLFKLFGKHSYVILGVFSISLIFIGIQTTTYANFSFGLIGGVLSLALLVRYISSRFIEDSETVNQIGGTLEGGLVLIAANLPLDFWEPMIGEMSQPGPWFWPLGGGINTAAAVWLLMSNTKILIFLLNLILARFSGLKAVTKTAISYPMASKFRTGITVAMFALIIYTLMIFSVLNGLNDISTEQPDRVTGGYDIKATITPDLPINGDIRDSLNMQDFAVVAGLSSLDVEAKEVDGENKTFKSSKLASLEDQFINSNQWRMSNFDTNYGATDQDIWKALLEDPSLVVASAAILESGDPFGPPSRGFKTSLVSPEDLKEIESFEIEVKRRRSSDLPVKLTVIGVIESLAGGQGFGGGTPIGFYSSKTLVSEIAKENVPMDTFYFSLNNKEDATEYAQRLEKLFISNGMNAESLMDNIENERATSNAFNKLFQGFSGLGLVVGVAAIGVLSVRAVVERRQSVGMLRAIGFRSSMIRTQFLIESSFITILGVVVGILLGILQSWLIFREISKELEGASFSVPIGEVGFLIALTVVASILASVIPANQASKIYPAEALRYE